MDRTAPKGAALMCFAPPWTCTDAQNELIALDFRGSNRLVIYSGSLAMLVDAAEIDIGSLEPL